MNSVLARGLEGIVSSSPHDAVVITVGIAEDHALVREAVQERLSVEPDLRVVLLDIDMPGLLCFEAARQIKQLSPSTRVVLFSAFVTDHYIQEAISVGVWGYVSKSEPADALVHAIRLAIRGQRYFSPQIQSRLVVDDRRGQTQAGEHSRIDLLTARERQILVYLAQGLTRKQIAETAHLSSNTVARHTANIMVKLQIHDRVQLARYAFREGLLEP